MAALLGWGECLVLEARIHPTSEKKIREKKKKKERSNKKKISVVAGKA